MSRKAESILGKGRSHQSKIFSIAYGLPLKHRWQTQGPQGESGSPPCFIQPGTCFYWAAALSSLPLLGVVTFIQSQSYIWPFEGSCEADVAPGENEFDTPALNTTSDSRADT